MKSNLDMTNQPQHRHWPQQKSQQLSCHKKNIFISLVFSLYLAPFHRTNTLSSSHPYHLKDSSFQLLPATSFKGEQDHKEYKTCYRNVLRKQ